jgi:hypothetical protein
LFAWRPSWRDAFGTLVLRSRQRFYMILAVLFVIAGAVDQFVHPFTAGLSNASFDWLMRHRPIPYRPDPDIVVLDIDEASLAELNPEFGRWPWPRELLARVAARIEAAGARVVMFDILFADPDVANPQSEEAFDRYVRSSKRSFYPVVRLDARNDASSEIKVADLNFVERDSSTRGAPAAGRTVALLSPYFKSIYDTTRLGTNNIEPDADNVIRSYPNYERLSGYRLPSLPDRIARDLGWPRQAAPRSIMNWPRDLAAYTTLPFVQAYRALGQPDSPFFRQFAGRIVLIGSTAASLNDIKATPVDSAVPGIYVLATALDNMKHDAFLHTPPHWMIWALEILLLAFAAFVFRRTAYVDSATRLLRIPAALLLLALISISVSTLLLDLSVPVATVLSYFTIAQIFRKLEGDFVAGHEAFAFTPQETEGRHLEVAAVPSSYSRDAMLNLIQTHAGIKLWEPLALGLGVMWGKQGWLLWRWSDLDSTTGAPPTEPPSLRWIRASSSPQDANPEVLAAAIAQAFHLAAHDALKCPPP